MKCFLHLALTHWGYAPPICVIDNTNLARWRGLGANAVMVPEMEAFGKAYGFRFVCHAPKHSDRKAGEERSFLTVETNFIPGRVFQDMEDLSRQALEWSTVRMEQRPQGKAGLIPAQAFEHERLFLTPLPRHLPAPYLLLERTVDEYGYVAVEANYYEVPGCGRGKIQVLRYLHHLVLCQDRRALIEYALPPWGVKNQPFHAPGQKPRHRPRNRKLSSQEEEKRLRAIDPVIGAYVDFILGTPGLLRHQFLRRLWAFSQRWSTALFLRTIVRAHRYHITSLATLERIALLYLDDTALPEPVVDPDLEKRPAYQEGSLTETPDLLNELHRSQADRSQNQVIRRYVKYELLLIDEIGYAEAEPSQVGLFFTLLQKRHKQRSTLITSNLGFSEWASFLKNPHLTAALIDRLTESSHLFNMRECVSLRARMAADP
jgi:hypothetical protein